ncbi:MAG TPA: ATP-dependent Clp protease ATP-binding subunit [Ignavibacteria bacterium]|nr:ATP-dependent Clp protease ATP-binding subunit [Ignavibacteria bacterium]
MKDHFSNHLKDAILISKAIVKEFSNSEISPSHLFKSMLHRRLPLRSKLEQLDKDVYYIENWLDFRIQKLPKSSKIFDNPEFDAKTIAVLNEAENIRVQYNLDKVDIQCVLAAICIPGVGYTFEQLKTLPIHYDEVVSIFFSNSGSKIKAFAKQNTSLVSDGKISSKQSMLDKFCINKTKLASEGKLDPVVGRDKEIRLISETLSRRSKPNAILVGEPGVGKTAVVDGIAQAIYEKKVTPKLQNAVIYELDIGSLIAGASYRGEVEDRLKKIIAEIKEHENAILFIDEIHLLVDKQGSTAGAGNILKPELSRGDFTIIGASTQSEFSKYVEGNEAFTRRFEIIRIVEPDDGLALQMLKAAIPKYESHHQITVTEDALLEAIQLSKRFSKERKLPDSAIDLLDRSMAALQMMNEVTATEVEDIKLKYSELETNLANQKADFKRGLLKEFYSTIGKQISYLMLASVNYNPENLSRDNIRDLKQVIHSVLKELDNRVKIKLDKLTPDNITAVVSYKTGIPIGKLKSSEQERLLKIEGELKKRVVGQEPAIREIAQAIRRSRAGIRKENKPIGSFFLVGPTGTGKTELARTLANYLFQDENSMIRFDMSEFTEEASVSLLHGASPGYVGYEEGGFLVNEIRQKPYSVVLFDEIEKAHPGVFKIFYQILDEGKLHDKLGKEGDFTHAIILFTSNIGSESIIKAFRKDNKLPSEPVVKEEMKQYFPPAFINRLDKIVPFAPIHEKVISLIFDIHIKNVMKMLDRKSVKLKIDEKAKARLSALGYNIEYGARPLLGVIRDYIETPLANMIIGNEISEGDTVKVNINDANQFVWEISK